MKNKKLKKWVARSLESYDRITRILEETSLEIKEVAAMQKETDLEIKEVARIQKESSLELRKEMKESSLELRKEMKESSLELREEMKESSLELRKEIEEVARMQKETDRLQKETSLQMKRTDEKINKLGGLGANIGESTEIFFYHGFKESPSLNGVAFEETVHNIRARRGQYDIVLYGQNCVAVIEVKHKFHPKDVQFFVDKNLPKFKKIFPEHKNDTLYGAIAGFVVPQDAVDIAVEAGLFVFCQSGNNMKSLNDESFTPRIY